MKAKIISTIVIIFFASFSNAQTITNIKGKDIYISLPDGVSVNPGESVDFLGDDFELVATGEIYSISPGGSQILVRTKQGQVTKNLSIEFRRSPRSKPSTQPVSLLSEEERSILARGEISTPRYLTGAILGTYPLGLGIGHAIQGRYSDKGWIFTVGELGSVAVAMAGATSCVADTLSSSECDGSGASLLVLGALSYVGFRVWEIVDLWAAPPELNRRFRELKSRTDGGGSSFTMRPSIVPVNGQPGLGIVASF